MEPDHPYRPIHSSARPDVTDPRYHTGTAPSLSRQESEWYAQVSTLSKHLEEFLKFLYPEGTEGTWDQKFVQWYRDDVLNWDSIPIDTIKMFLQLYGFTKKASVDTFRKSPEKAVQFLQNLEFQVSKHKILEVLEKKGGRLRGEPGPNSQPLIKKKTKNYA